MSGGSGKLKTTLIGDYLLHQDLIELDQERQSYEAAMAKLKQKNQGKAKLETTKANEKSGGWFSSAKKEEEVTAASSST